MAAFNPAVGNIWGNSPASTTLTVNSEHRRNGKETPALLRMTTRATSSAHASARRIPFDKTRFNQKAPPRKLRLTSRDQAFDPRDLGLTTSVSLTSPGGLRATRSLPRLSPPILCLERKDDVPDAPTIAHSKSSSEFLTTFKLLL